MSLSRSVELSARWDRILSVGPSYLVTIDDLSAVRGLGIGDFHRVVADVHHRLSDFVHAVVVPRRDEAIREVAELDSGGPHGASLQVASS